MIIHPSVRLLMTTLTLICLGALVTASCNEKCPQVCDCYPTEDNGCKVTCTGKNLIKIPSPMPTNATLLDLSDNHLKSLPAMAFSKTKRLKILRIDNNDLESLHRDSLRGLTYLQELSLEQNNLHLDSTTFASDIFVDLVRLRQLKLRANQRLKGSYLDDSITKINSLESLYIVGFNRAIFGSGYRKLKRLNHVDFSSGTKSSFMNTIPERAFQNLPALKRLNLSNCHISKIHEKAFSFLSSLTVLDLSYNRRMTFLQLRVAFHGLKNSRSLRHLNISAVHPVFGLGTEVRIADIENLRMTSLKTIRFESNKLELFEDTALTLLPSTLEYISIKDNRLTFGNYLFEIYHLPNIRVIDASFTSSQHHLPYALATRNGSNSFPVTLEIMLYRECFYRYTLPYINMGYTNIRYVNASGNRFCPWHGPIKGLEKMTWLDLSNNMCRDVSDTFFSCFLSLRKLYLHDNLLGISSTVNGFNVLFHNLTKLESLRLSNNRIANMTKLSLAKQVNMTHLDLSNNLIESFQVQIGHMKNLSSLDLSDNFLKTLSVETFSEIETISLTQNITVNLLRNRLECTCRYIHFFKWVLHIKQSERVLLLYDKCIFSNGTFSSLQDGSLEKVVQYLDNSCSSFLSLILPSTVLILAVILLLSGSLLYRYRWNLRYFYLMIKERYSNRIENAENHMYDAFVSYAEEDCQFVINQMQPELEERGNLSLNIHQRDFIAGRPIVDNILTAIQQSRICLVLLSRSFLKSKWCLYEFSMAKMETIYAERDMVVVIMLEEVDSDTIPLELMHHLKTKSYIEYPTGDEQGKQLFWNHIKTLLQGTTDRT